MEESKSPTTIDADEKTKQEAELLVSQQEPSSSKNENKNECNTTNIHMHTGSLALDRFNNGSSSLAIPKYMAYGVLFLALVSSAMFFVGQTTPMWGLGASIQLVFKDSSNQPPISASYDPFKMSLFFSIKSCIETGLIAEVLLGVILFFFSGVWPHVKIGLMLYCWFAPMDHRYRQVVLYWVDSLGKFSFADPLVVVVLMVAFTVGVELTSGDFLFQGIAAFILEAEGLDESAGLTVDDVESIVIKLDIVAFYGIYFFCLGVWLSLILGTVVEWYCIRLLLILTDAEEVDAVTTVAVTDANGNTCNQLQLGPNHEKDDTNMGTATKFLKKTKWITGLVTIPITILLIISFIVPIFQRTIDGVLPMLVTAFGWFPNDSNNPPSAITQNLTFGDIFTFLSHQEGYAIYIMITTVILFCLAAPIFRSLVLDIMWCLPLQSLLVMSIDDDDSDGSSGASLAIDRHKADKILSTSNMSSIFDALAVWLFAVVLVHFEIGAISAQINMPFCQDVAVAAQIMESFCPELETLASSRGGAFWDDPIHKDALQLFTMKHPGWNETLFNINVTGEECNDIVAIAEGFNLSECLDTEIDFVLGMWCVTIAVLLAYASSILLTYPWSVMMYGRDFFEAPVCYRPEGWFCCCCCVGERSRALAGGDGNGSCGENDKIERFEYSCSKSMGGCCWCCKKAQKSE